MKYPIGLILALFAAQATAAPFIVSDPLDPRATHCGWVIDSGTKQDVLVGTAAADKVCKYDLSAVAVGTHTVTATAVAIDPVWGRMESASSVPFSFTRPAPSGVPTGFRLVP